jgi:O-antigen/teichoic acid export membrane protein
MEERALQGVPWTLLAYMGSRAVTLVSTLVLARLLVPSDFGLMALAIMVTSFLTWFAALGFAKTLILRQDLDRRGQGTVLTLTMGSSVLAALAAVGVAPLAANVFNDSRLTAIVAVMSTVLIVGGLASFYEAVLEGELEFRRRFVGYGAQSVVSTVVSISLAVAGAGVWSLVTGQLAGFATLALMLMALSPYRVRPRFDAELVPQLCRESGGFIAQGITGFLRWNTDSVIVGSTFGTAPLGFYSMAFRLGDLSYWAISGPVSHVTFPAFARARERGEDIRGAFLSVLRMMALVGFPFGIILSAGAEPLTRALFGEKWLSMIGPLSIIGIWAALRPLDTTLSWGLNSIGRAGSVGWVSVAILVPLVPALIVASNLGRLSAVALVIVADIAVALVITVFLVRRYLEVSIRAMWTAVWPMVFAGPAMWLATWSVGRAIGPDYPLIGLTASVLCGLLAYVAVICLLDRALLPRAGSIVRAATATQPSA